MSKGIKMTVYFCKCGSPMFNRTLCTRCYSRWSVEPIASHGGRALREEQEHLADLIRIQRAHAAAISAERATRRSRTWHRITTRNDQQTVGVCSVCGPVRLLSQGQCSVKEAANSRREQMRKKYGIDPEIYDLMAKTQNGRCAICDRPSLKLVVDHDHATGSVRALLCGPCNSGIGMLQDDPELVARALRYLHCHRAHDIKAETA